MANKYPYIPREYYSAVMFACKMIRENGYFNKAINIASSYYDVDKKELEKHVKRRTKAGQKSRKKIDKYYWYVISDTDYYNTTYYIQKASNSKKAELNVFGKNQDYFFSNGLTTKTLKKCNTENEAKISLKNIIEKRKKELDEIREKNRRIDEWKNKHYKCPICGGDLDFDEFDFYIKADMRCKQCRTWLKYKYDIFKTDYKNNEIIIA